MPPRAQPPRAYAAVEGPWLVLWVYGAGSLCLRSQARVHGRVQARDGTRAIKFLNQADKRALADRLLRRWMGLTLDQALAAHAADAALDAAASGNSVDSGLTTVPE